MKLIKQLTLTTLALSSLVSGFTTANEMEITANNQKITQNNKFHIYSGNVRIAFNNANLTTKSSHATFENGKTVMEGDVEIILDNAIAKTQRVTFTPSDHGFVAEMDKVTFTYK